MNNSNKRKDPPHQYATALGARNNNHHGYESDDSHESEDSSGWLTLSTFDNLNLDDFWKIEFEDNQDWPNKLQRQVQLLDKFLSHPDPKIRWRAMWSIEDIHDGSFLGLRLEIFHRFPREPLRENDPWRADCTKPFVGNPVFYPGVNACHDRKCVWAGMVMEECAGNDMRPSFDTTWERDPDIPSLEEGGTIVSDILLSGLVGKGVETISVCLFIDRQTIDGYLDVAVVQEEERRSFMIHSGMSREEVNRQMGPVRQYPGLENIDKFLSSPYIRSDCPSQFIFDGQDEVEQAEDNAVLTKLCGFKQWLKEKATARLGKLHHHDSLGRYHQEPQLTKLPPKRFDELSSGWRVSDMLKDMGTRNDDLVLLARRDDVPREANTEEVLKDMMASLGLRDDVVIISPTSGRNLEIPGYAYRQGKFIGGNLHYPDDDERTSVAFTWSGTMRLTEEHEQRRRYLQAFETPFALGAKTKKEASNGRLHCILWPRNVDWKEGSFSRDTTAVTAENAHLIWLPGDYDNIEEAIFNRCLNGDGLPPTFASALRHGTTYSGNVFWDIVLEYYEEVIIEGSQTSTLLEEHQTIPNKDSLQLCLLLGLTRTLMQADHLLMDHEHSTEELQDFFDGMAKQWRKVCRKSDEKLGLGLTGLECSDITDSDTPRASREGLHGMLKYYESKIADMMHDLELDISFVPV